MPQELTLAMICHARTQLHNEMQTHLQTEQMPMPEHVHECTWPLPNQLTFVQFVRCRPMLRVHRRAQASVGRLAEAQRLLAALLQDAAAFRCEHELMPLRDCSLNV
jgi:hypothetical protein